MGRLFSFIFRGIRWRILLQNLSKNHSILECIQLTFVGYAINNVFPARAGEISRAYLVGKGNGISKTSSLATIFVERIFDGLTIVVILAILLFINPFPGWVKTLSYIGGALFSILFFLVFRKPHLAIRVIMLPLKSMLF